MLYVNGIMCSIKGLKAYVWCRHTDCYYWGSGSLVPKRGFPALPCTNEGMAAGVVFLQGWARGRLERETLLLIICGCHEEELEQDLESERKRDVALQQISLPAAKYPEIDPQTLLIDSWRRMPYLHCRIPASGHLPIVPSTREMPMKITPSGSDKTAVGISSPNG